MFRYENLGKQILSREVTVISTLYTVEQENIYNSLVEKLKALKVWKPAKYTHPDPNTWRAEFVLNFVDNGQLPKIVDLLQKSDLEFFVWENKQINK